MKKAFIVHSKHTLNYAEKISKKYNKVAFLQVNKTPTAEIIYNKVPEDFIVIGIGGGSVIDTAKILSRPNKCIAIPTTASGACATPYATVWGKEKQSIKTAKPIIKLKKDIKINLPKKVEISTLCDATSHAIESLISKNNTFISRHYAKKAIKNIKRYIQNKDVFTLIKAGNLAGKAIAINKTNTVHAISYPLTINYNINHGIACGLILIVICPNLLEEKRIYSYIKRNLGKIVDCNKIKKIKPTKIANEAIKYKKIKLRKADVIYILKRIKREFK